MVTTNAQVSDNLTGSTQVNVKSFISSVLYMKWMKYICHDSYYLKPATLFTLC